MGKNTPKGKKETSGADPQGSPIEFTFNFTEASFSSVKKFRQSPEIEGFYRFVYENDLRKEAYIMIERVLEKRRLKKTVTSRKN